MFSSIESIGEKKWSAVANQSIFSQYDFLVASAVANIHLEHRYILVEIAGELIAAFYVQIVPFHGSELRSYVPEKDAGILKRSIQGMVDCALQKVNWSLAVFGNIFVTGEKGQFWIKEIPQKERWEVLSEVSVSLAEKENVDAFLITELYEEDWKDISIIRAKKFRPIEVEPDMLLEINSTWQNFNDYLASFSSKYRVRCKKVYKTSKNVLVRELSLDDLTRYRKELFHLYQNVLEKVDFKLSKVSIDYHLTMKKHMPNQYFVKGYFIDDKLVGFISCFDDGADMGMHLIGMDYALNRDFKLYQRILYDCVAQGIEAKKERIHFGRTASIIKMTVGAKPHSVKSLIKHNQRISNIAIKPLTTYLKPEPFEPRHPFK